MELPEEMIGLTKYKKILLRKSTAPILLALYVAVLLLQHFLQLNSVLSYLIVLPFAALSIYHSFQLRQKEASALYLVLIFASVVFFFFVLLQPLTLLGDGVFRILSRSIALLLWYDTLAIFVNKAEFK